MKTVNEEKYRRIWEFFNETGQGKFGLAMYHLENNNIEKAKKYFDEFQEVWTQSFKIK